jgi:hypothetical protein
MKIITSPDKGNLIGRRFSCYECGTVSECTDTSDIISIVSKSGIDLRKEGTEIKVMVWETGTVKCPACKTKNTVSSETRWVPYKPL